MAREVLLVPAEALRPLGIRTALDEPAGALLVGCRDPRLAGRRLLLDPGHGGRDPGAVGPRGSREASVTLEVAQRCASLLALAGAAPSLTRTTDRTVSLPVRVALAESRRAELFLSVHANSFTDPRVHGTETYYYETWESRRLAEAVQRELVAELDLADRGVKEASFYVLRQTRLPACLAELAFLSNPREEELLAVPWFRLKAATALFRGVRSFVEGRTA
jgi:N-acetylmuramoyl-L-alanine amidase